jgi:hypothetical protein
MVVACRRLLHRRHVQDAVGVNVERDLDLRVAPLKTSAGASLAACRCRYNVVCPCRWPCWRSLARFASRCCCCSQGCRASGVDRVRQCVPSVWLLVARQNSACSRGEGGVRLVFVA